MTPAPIITTERLTLRGPEARDFEPVAAFFADADRSRGFGGPMDRPLAWRWFACMIGHWHLRGYGFWFLETQAGDTVGMVGLWCPEGWPEPELGWVMFAASEGNGYAAEAALALRHHAYAAMGFDTLTSNILPGNERSIALAERLGAVYEGDHESVAHGSEHVYRHPGPEASA